MLPARFVVCECKIEALIHITMSHTKQMSESTTTQLEISASDTVGVILGDYRSGKSTLCNRLCTTIDFPQDGCEVADVYSGTDKPCVYTLRNSKHSKILDVPSYRSQEFPDEDMASFVARNHLHRADYVIVIWSHRHRLPCEDLATWCHKNDKPIVFVFTAIHDFLLMEMQVNKCSQSEARVVLNRRDRECQFPCFSVDTKQWQTAIEAYEAGEYDAAKLHYDESELLQFVARVGQAKSTLGGSVSAFFQSYVDTEQGLRNESESFETTQLETALLKVHYYSRNRLDQPSSGGVSSVETQTELPPAASSRAVRLSPTFFQ